MSASTRRGDASADQHQPLVHGEPLVCRGHQGVRQVLQAGGDGIGRGDSPQRPRRYAPAPSGAPVFAEAIAWFDCEVRKTIDFGTHTLFAGEITAAAVNDDETHAAAMSDTRMNYGGVKRHSKGVLLGFVWVGRALRHGCMALKSGRAAASRWVLGF